MRFLHLSVLQRPCPKIKPESGAKGLSESGNVLFIILIGVALFAALSFMFTRSNSGGAGNVVSSQQASILAREVIGYADQIDQAVNALMAQGVAETDICFYTGANNAAYNHAGCANDLNKVFGAKGMPYQAPPQGSSASEWYFTGRSIVTGVGTDAPELIVLLMNIPQGLCTAINDSLNRNFATIETGVGSFNTSPRFDGTYTVGSGQNEDISSAAALQGKTSYCFQESGNGQYHFMRVLHAR